MSAADERMSKGAQRDEQQSACVSEARGTVARFLPMAAIGIGATHVIAQQFLPAYQAFNWRPKLWWGAGAVCAFSYFKGERALEACRRRYQRENVLADRAAFREQSKR